MVNLEKKLDAELEPEEPSFFITADRVDVVELCIALWRRKLVVVVTTLLFLVGAFFYAKSKPDIYKAEAVLAPASGGNSTTNLAGQFGGLASFVGMSIGAELTKEIIAMELIKSWGFLEDFVKNNNLQAEIYAVEAWDKVNDKLIYDASLYDVDSKLWRVENSEVSSVKDGPSGWSLYKKLNSMLAVNRDKETGLIRISVQHVSPKIAAQLVTLITLDLNEYMKTQDMVEARKSLRFLKGEVSKTSVTEMRKVFYQLIEEQTKTLMLATVGGEYVLKTVSRAKVPQEKILPRRTLVASVGGLVGGICGVFMVLLLEFSSFKIQRRDKGAGA